MDTGVLEIGRGDESVCLIEELVQWLGAKVLRTDMQHLKVLRLQLRRCGKHLRCIPWAAPPQVAAALAATAAAVLAVAVAVTAVVGWWVGVTVSWPRGLGRGGRRME